MIDVVMPQLGESVAEGTVTKWLVREGDFVVRQQPIVVVSTDASATPARGVARRKIENPRRNARARTPSGKRCRIKPWLPVATDQPAGGPATGP